MFLVIHFQFSVLLETIAMIIRATEITHTHTLNPSALPGGDFDCSPTDDWESQKLNAESVKASFSGPVASQRPRENSCGSSSQSQCTASEHFQEDTLDHPSEFFLNLCCTHIIPPFRARK